MENFISPIHSCHWHSKKWKIVENISRQLTSCTAKMTSLIYFSFDLRGCNMDLFRTLLSYFAMISFIFFKIIFFQLFLLPHFLTESDLQTTKFLLSFFSFALLLIHNEKKIFFTSYSFLQYPTRLFNAQKRGKLVRKSLGLDLNWKVMRIWIKF